MSSVKKLNDIDDNQLASRDRDWRGKFVWSPVFVIVSVHVLSLFAFQFISLKNVVGFLISHFLVGGIGAVIGLHRYFSHKSFTCHPAIENILGFLGTLNIQNGPLKWAMYHRAHHRFSDGVGDPHSSARGFYWSHIGWMFYICPNGFRKNTISIKDLSRSRFLVFIDKYHILVNIAAGALFLAATQDVGLFLWVFPLRTVVVWHSTWLINSYVHRAPVSATASGPRPIRNSWLISLIMYGDGWHANHHKHPGNFSPSEKESQYDPAFWVVWALNKVGLAYFKIRS